MTRYTLWLLLSLVVGCRFGSAAEAPEAAPPSADYARLGEQIEQLVQAREEEALRGEKDRSAKDPLTPEEEKRLLALADQAEEVVAAGERWVQENPRDEAADNCLYQLALLHRYERGEPEAAWSRLERLRRDYPQSDVLPRALFEEGSLALDAADFPAAREAFQQLQQMKPPPDWAARAWLGLAAAERALKHYEAARAAYRAFLENHAADGAAPQSLRRWVEMGLDEEGDLPAAADRLLEFAANYPHSRLLGWLANRLANRAVTGAAPGGSPHDLATADRVLAHFAEHSAVWREEAARKRNFLQEYNDFEGRPLTLFLAAEEETGFSRSVAAAGQIEPLPYPRRGLDELLRKASQEGSTRQLDELLEKYPQSRLADEALHLLAKLPGREGHEATVRRLFEQYPQSGYCDEAAWEVLRYLTGNYYSLGSLRQPAEQIRILSQYLQHRPTGELAPLFRAHRGHLRLWTEADFTGAAEDLREAIKMIEKVERLPLVPPKMALQKARNDLAQITSELGESPAPPPAEEGLSADEVSARAQQHLEAGRPLQALRAYRLALEKARESTEQAWLKLSLAELFLRVSLPLEEVESWLKEIVEPLRGTHVTIVEPLRGTHVADEVRFLLEEVQMARGHFSDAAHFSIVFPGRALPMPTDRRGRALYLSGYVREHTDGPSDPARNAYEQVLREFPTSPWADWARFRLGCLAAAEGHFAQAAAEYQQLLERDLAPELRLEVLAALAYAQLEQGNVEEAAKTLQSAPEATPSVAAVMILLRARQGENERVLEEGERFLVAHPYHDYAAAVGLARAEVLRAWQRTEEAQQQLYQASHAYPPPRLLRILQERLQTLPLPPPRPPSPVESRWATWAARYRLLPELQDEDGRALQQLAGRFLEKRTGKAPEADRFVVTDIEYDALKARAVVFFQTWEAGYRLEAVWRDGRWIVTQARMEWIA